MIFLKVLLTLPIMMHVSKKKFLKRY